MLRHTVARRGTEGERGQPRTHERADGRTRPYLAKGVTARWQDRVYSARRGAHAAEQRDMRAMPGARREPRTDSGRRARRDVG